MSTPDKVMTPCPSCGARLGVPLTAAGKKIRCPKCQTIVAITADMVNQPPEMVAPPAEVLKAVPRPEVSLGGENTFAGAPQKKKYAPESLGDQATFGGGDGSADDHFTDEMEIVDLAGRYKVEGVLGKGGMGEVLLATDTRLNRKVAIKRMLGDAAKSRTAVSRFLIEAKSIAALNHPNIVQIYDYGRDKDGPFLILEYVDGKRLLDKCYNNPLFVEEAVNLTCQLCDGLGTAHDANIIHRDIKPANVLLTKNGVPKLTDFGLAKDEAADGGLSVAGAVLGTLDFMPPEQRRDATLADARSDLWSLAATLYQMVTGKSPRIIQFNHVPQSLQVVLGKALEEKKDDRYQTAREFRDALKTCLTAAPTSPVPVAELGAGECAKCRTRNDANRKFCGKCAAPLRVSCLQCSKQIPVWDTVCGDCGGKQSDLIQIRVAEYGTQLEQAEQYRSDYQFEQALELAKAVAAVEDDRLAEHKPWADEFMAATQLQWQREKDSAQQHYAEAQKHRAASDYPSAMHAIEQIPAVMRSGEVDRYLVDLQSSHSEAEELIRTITERVQRRDLDGLRQDVERAVELRGDRLDLQKLRVQLLDRESKLIAQRDDAFTKAADLLSAGDAVGGLDLLKSVQWKERRESDRKLQQRLREIVESEQALAEVVQRCKADGVPEADEVIEMYIAADGYLKLNSRHAKIQELHAQLAVRMQKPSLMAKVSADRCSPELLAQLPVSVLSNLPATVLVQLPPEAFAKIPPDVCSAFLVALPPLRNSVGMELRLLPSGLFEMGEGSKAHQVTLMKPFYLGVHEVTQSQYQQVMGANPSKFKGAQNPVEQVRWEDAVEFCRKLSELPEEKAAGQVYRLPTEAEWEFACRAGTTTKFSFGGSESELGEYAWYEQNSGDATHPVGQKKPNAWGLYDMHGNVWEWCSDWYDDYPERAVTDPVGPADGSYRVFRGGGWSLGPALCRAAYRGTSDPSYRFASLGFRLALSFSGIPK